MKRETTFVYYISWALSFDYLVNYNISRYAVSRLQQQITEEEPVEIKKRFGYNQTLAATISFTSLPPSPLIHWVKDSGHSIHHHGQELLLINFTIFSSFFPELRRPSMNQQCDNVNGRRAGSPGGPFNLPKLCTVSEVPVQAKVGRWSNFLNSSEYHGNISIIINSRYQ
jgi:hypothetical protein